jgi:hypothetical protein
MTKQLHHDNNKNVFFLGIDFFIYSERYSLEHKMEGSMRLFLGRGTQNSVRDEINE